MRNMSFALTTDQIIAETETETSRLGWWFLQHGDIVCAVKKGMGLKKGEKVQRLKTIYIISAFPERLNLITQESVAREGFPGKSSKWFIDFFCHANKCSPYVMRNRIIFKYVNNFPPIK